MTQNHGGTMTPDELRIAAVFDGDNTFTPDRVRVIDPDGRAAIGRYLTEAPLVIRAAGLEPDPLDPSRGPVVPVGYRTDGVWVWQEATAYYLAERWVAPEDGLLEQIERAGFTPPTELPDEVLDAAAAAAVDPAYVRPADPRTIQYYLRTDEGYGVENPRGLFRIWTDERGLDHEESLRWTGRGDSSEPAPPYGMLRWGPTSRFASNRRNGEIDLDPFPVADAARALDVIVARAAATPFSERPGRRASA
jgi:hypothetical protein